MHAHAEGAAPTAYEAVPWKRPVCEKPLPGCRTVCPAWCC